MMTALPKKYYCSGDRKVTEKEQDTWKIDLMKEKWTAGFKYSWRKMEVAGQDRAG